MHAQQLTAAAAIDQHPLQAAQRAAPAPGPGQVRVRVSACGVCHTDLHLVEGEVPLHQQPLIPGHQIVGQVDQTGPGVTGWAVGDRVGIPWLHTACGTCFYCLRGQENLCDQARFTGWDVDGGYAEYALAEADFVVPLPAGFSDAQAAPLLCAGVIGYRALRLAEVQPGDRVGLFGFGASAHLALQVARHWQCPVSVFTRSAAHQAEARALGAEWCGQAADRPPHLLDRAILFAPAGGLVPQALEHLRKGGCLAINAIHLSPIPVLDYARLYGERTLRSVSHATRQDARDFLALAGTIPIHTDIQEFPLAEANQALQHLKHSALRGAAVLIP